MEQEEREENLNCRVTRSYSNNAPEGTSRVSEDEAGDEGGRVSYLEGGGADAGVAGEQQQQQQQRVQHTAPHPHTLFISL